MDFACLNGGQFVVIVLDELASNLKSIVEKKYSLAQKWQMTEVLWIWISITKLDRFKKTPPLM